MERRFKLLVWSGIILLVLAISAFLVWFLLTNSSVANVSWVMPIRRDFFIKDSLGLKPKMQNLPFSIIALRQGDVDGKPAYLYAFLGKFRKVDLVNKTLTLQNKNGKLYTFDFQLVYYETDGIKQAKRLSLAVNQNDPTATVSPFVANDVFMIYFNDTRTASQIMAGSSEIYGVRSVTRYIKND